MADKDVILKVILHTCTLPIKLFLTTPECSWRHCITAYQWDVVTPGGKRYLLIKQDFIVSIL